jgi:competence protein ComGC
MRIRGLKHRYLKHDLPCTRQHGAALIEYIIVAFLFVLLLVAGPNVMHQLALALGQVYQSFVFVLSAP